MSRGDGRQSRPAAELTMGLAAVGHGRPGGLAGYHSVLRIDWRLYRCCQRRRRTGRACHPVQCSPADLWRGLGGSFGVGTFGCANCTIIRSRSARVNSRFFFVPGSHWSRLVGAPWFVRDGALEARRSSHCDCSACPTSAAASARCPRMKTPYAMIRSGDAGLPSQRPGPGSTRLRSIR